MNYVDDAMYYDLFTFCYLFGAFVLLSPLPLSTHLAAGAVWGLPLSPLLPYVGQEPCCWGPLGLGLVRGAHICLEK